MEHKLHHRLGVINCSHDIKFMHIKTFNTLFHLLVNSPGGCMHTVKVKSVATALVISLIEH